MTDLTPVLNELLRSHNAPPTASPSLTLANIDEFLKEAYRINSHIASLNTYLKNIRQSYLSTTAPPSKRSNLQPKEKQWQRLTDRQREEIDAETKRVLRELNGYIRKLADAEKLRQNTETTITRKKYARLGLGALGSWAAGGGGHTKSFEEDLDEAKAKAINMHRESVLWYLGKKLEECGSLQASMMEKRIMREMEKNRSNLAKSRANPMLDLGSFDNGSGSSSTYKTSGGLHLETEQANPEDELTPEQIQLFEKENQDMLKHYQSTLNQVRTAEKSLIEISELQTQLVNNLAIQSAHIEQLVVDSHFTNDNIGGGNKELKKAAERPSTAKYVFYASCGLSVFLVVWDLII